MNLPSAALAWAVLLLLLGGCAAQSTRDLPSDSPARLNVELGKAYINEGDYSQALVKLERALEQAPGYPPALGAMAVLHQRLGEFDQAERRFREAIRLDPSDSVTRNNFGAFLCKRERYEEAEREFLAAVENPLYGAPEHAYTNAGLCALRRPDLDSAEGHFRAALRHNPKFAPALLQMARVSLEQEQYLQSRAYLQRYDEVAPHNPVSLWLSVRTERKLGDRGAAASHALLLKSRFPDAEETRQLLKLEADER